MAEKAALERVCVIAGNVLTLSERREISQKSLSTLLALFQGGASLVRWFVNSARANSSSRKADGTAAATHKSAQNNAQDQLLIAALCALACSVCLELASALDSPCPRAFDRVARNAACLRAAANAYPTGSLDTLSSLPLPLLHVHLRHLMPRCCSALTAGHTESSTSKPSKAPLSSTTRPPTRASSFTCLRVCYNAAAALAQWAALGSTLARWIGDPQSHTHLAAAAAVAAHACGVVDAYTATLTPAPTPSNSSRGGGVSPPPSSAAAPRSTQRRTAQGGCSDASSSTSPSSLTTTSATHPLLPPTVALRVTAADAAAAAAACRLALRCGDKQNALRWVGCAGVWVASAVTLATQVSEGACGASAGTLSPGCEATSDRSLKQTEGDRCGRCAVRGWYAKVDGCTMNGAACVGGGANGAGSGDCGSASASGNGGRGDREVQAATQRGVKVLVEVLEGLPLAVGELCRRNELGKGLDGHDSATASDAVHKASTPSRQAALAAVTAACRVAYLCSLWPPLHRLLLRVKRVHACPTLQYSNTSTPTCSHSSTSSSVASLAVSVAASLYPSLTSLALTTLPPSAFRLTISGVCGVAEGSLQNKGSAVRQFCWASVDAAVGRAAVSLLTAYAGAVGDPSTCARAVGALVGSALCPPSVVMGAGTTSLSSDKVVKGRGEDSKPLPPTGGGGAAPAGHAITPPPPSDALAGRCDAEVAFTVVSVAAETLGEESAARALWRTAHSSHGHEKDGGRSVAQMLWGAVAGAASLLSLPTAPSPLLGGCAADSPPTPPASSSTSTSPAFPIHTTVPLWEGVPFTTPTSPALSTDPTPPTSVHFTAIIPPHIANPPLFCAPPLPTFEGVEGLIVGDGGELGRVDVCAVRRGLEGVGGVVDALSWNVNRAKPLGSCGASASSTQSTRGTLHPHSRPTAADALLLSPPSRTIAAPPAPVPHLASPPTRPPRDLNGVAYSVAASLAASLAPTLSDTPSWCETVAIQLLPPAPSPTSPPLLSPPSSMPSPTDAEGVTPTDESAHHPHPPPLITPHRVHKGHPVGVSDAANTAVRPSTTHLPTSSARPTRPFSTAVAAVRACPSLPSPVVFPLGRGVAAAEALRAATRRVEVVLSGRSERTDEAEEGGDSLKSAVKEGRTGGRGRGRGRDAKASTRAALERLLRWSVEQDVPTEMHTEKRLSRCRRSVSVGAEGGRRGTMTEDVGDGTACGAALALFNSPLPPPTVSKALFFNSPGPGGGGGSFTQSVYVDAASAVRCRMEEGEGITWGTPRSPKGEAVKALQRSTGRLQRALSAAADAALGALCVQQLVPIVAIAAPAAFVPLPLCEGYTALLCRTAEVLVRGQCYSSGKGDEDTRRGKDGGRIVRDREDDRVARGEGEGVEARTSWNESERVARCALLLNVVFQCAGASVVKLTRQLLRRWEEEGRLQEYEPHSDLLSSQAQAVASTSTGLTTPQHSSEQTCVSPLQPLRESNTHHVRASLSGKVGGAAARVDDVSRKGRGEGDEEDEGYGVGDSTKHRGVCEGVVGEGVACSTTGGVMQRPSPLKERPLLHTQPRDPVPAVPTRKPHVRGFPKRREGKAAQDIQEGTVGAANGDANVPMVGEGDAAHSHGEVVWNDGVLCKTPDPKAAVCLTPGARTGARRRGVRGGGATMRTGVCSSATKQPQPLRPRHRDSLSDVSSPPTAQRAVEVLSAGPAAPSERDSEQTGGRGVGQEVLVCAEDDYGGDRSCGTGEVESGLGGAIHEGRCRDDRPATKEQASCEEEDEEEDVEGWALRRLSRDFATSPGGDRAPPPQDPTDDVRDGEHFRDDQRRLSRVQSMHHVPCREDASPRTTYLPKTLLASRLSPHTVASLFPLTGSGLTQLDSALGVDSRSPADSFAAFVARLGARGSSIFSSDGRLRVDLLTTLIQAQPIAPIVAAAAAAQLNVPASDLLHTVTGKRVSPLASDASAGGVGSRLIPRSVCATAALSELSDLIEVDVKAHAAAFDGGSLPTALAEAGQGAENGEGESPFGITTRAERRSGVGGAGRKRTPMHIARVCTTLAEVAGAVAVACVESQGCAQSSEAHRRAGRCRRPFTFSLLEAFCGVGGERHGIEESVAQCCGCNAPPTPRSTLGSFALPGGADRAVGLCSGATVAHHTVLIAQRCFSTLLWESALRAAPWAKPVNEVATCGSIERRASFTPLRSPVLTNRLSRTLQRNGGHAAGCRARAFTYAGAVGSHHITRQGFQTALPLAPPPPFASPAPHSRAMSSIPLALSPSASPSPLKIGESSTALLRCAAASGVTVERTVTRMDSWRGFLISIEKLRRRVDCRRLEGGDAVDRLAACEGGSGRYCINVSGDFVESESVMRPLYESVGMKEACGVYSAGWGEEDAPKLPGAVYQDHHSVDQSCKASPLVDLHDGAFAVYMDHGAARDVPTVVLAAAAAAEAVRQDSDTFQGTTNSMSASRETYLRQRPANMGTMMGLFGCSSGRVALPPSEAAASATALAACTVGRITHCTRLYTCVPAALCAVTERACNRAIAAFLRHWLPRRLAEAIPRIPHQLLHAAGGGEDHLDGATKAQEKGDDEGVDECGDVVMSAASSSRPQCGSHPSGTLASAHSPCSSSIPQPHASCCGRCTVARELLQSAPAALGSAMSYSRFRFFEGGVFVCYGLPVVCH